MTAKQHKTRTFKIEDLQAYDQNPRRGDVAQIMESLKHFGQFRTIVVNVGTLTGKANEVLAGNHTLLAAKELGWTSLSATVVDVDADTAKRIMLADNRSSDRAEYDEELLATLLQSLPTLDGTGYEAEDVADLLAQMEEEASSFAKKSELPVQPHESDRAPKFPDREQWEEAARRLVVLDYPREQYAWIQDALEKVGDLLGTDSNAETVVVLLKEKLGE